MNVTSDLIKFIEALLIGIGFSLLYDVLRALKYELLNNKVFEFIKDFLCFLLLSVVTFSYVMLRNSGQMRVFFLIGELCGMILYFFTVSKYLVKFFRWVFAFFRKSVCFLVNPIVKLIKFICKKIKIQIKYLVIKNKIKKCLENYVDNGV